MEQAGGTARWRGSSQAGRFLAALALLSLCPARRLAAHATLLRSSPVPGQRVAQAPARLALGFSERIEEGFHSLRLVDQEGNEYPLGEARTSAGGETLSAPLPGLPPGRYAVYWRINSLDGHQVRGQFGFGVAADPPTAIELIAWQPRARPSVPGWFFPLLKLLSLLALAVWLGGLAPHAWSPGASPAAPDAVRLHGSFLRRSGQLALAAGVAFLLIELVALPGKSAVFRGVPYGEALAPGVLLSTLAGSSYGHWWLARFLAAALLLALTAALARSAAASSARAFTCWALGAVIAAAIAATGHAQAAAGSLPLAALMDGLHLAAALLWAGGLFHLGLGVGTATGALSGDGTAAEWLAWITPRFSRMAQVCIAVLFSTGIYNTWLHVPAWQAFVTTFYGRTLLGKLIWVALTLAVAFINWRKVLPELARRRAAAGTFSWASRFQPLLQAEFAGCVIVFASAALLANMPPATADPNAGPRELRQTIGATEVTLRVDPGRLGVNRLEVRLAGKAGQPPLEARRVMLYLRMLEMDMGLLSAPAAPQAPGGFAADMAFTMAGRWKVSVEITPVRGDAFVLEYDVTIQ